MVLRTENVIPARYGDAASAPCGAGDRARGWGRDVGRCVPAGAGCAARAISGADGSAARGGGQRQRWFALRFTGEDADIRLDLDPHPEFDAWRWAELSELPALAVDFKRAIYQELVQAFADWPQRIARGDRC